MVKNHLSRLAAPKTWPIKRKISKFVTRPKPGPHKLERSMPLLVIIRDILNYAKTSREVKKILNEGKIKINNKIRKDVHYPVGLMDTISIESNNEYFRVLFNKNGKLIIHPIQKEESTLKPLRIINKTCLKKKKIQLNFDDGRNIIIDKNNYKVFDTVLYDLQKNLIVSHFKFEKGALIYLIDGNQIGSVGVLQDIHTFKSSQPNRIIFTKDKNKFETLEDYAVVIGKEKPIISIPGEDGK